MSDGDQDLDARERAYRESIRGIPKLAEAGAAIPEAERHPTVTVLMEGQGWLPNRCHADGCTSLVDLTAPWVRYHATVFQGPDGRVFELYHEHKFGMLYCSEACLRAQFEHGATAAPQVKIVVAPDGAQAHERYLKPKDRLRKRQYRRHHALY